MSIINDKELNKISGGIDRPTPTLMVTCPNCGHEFNAFEYLGSGIISIDGDSISTGGYTCPSCGHLFTK